MNLSLFKLAIALAIATALGLTLPWWAAWPLCALIGACLGAWPAGLEIGPLRLLEGLDGLVPFGVRILAWRMVGPIDHRYLRWSFAWIAPASWRLHAPDFTHRHTKYDHCTERALVLLLPLVGDFSLILNRDTPPAEA